MKRNKINKKVPAYAFGLDQAGQLASIAGTTLQGTGNETMATIGGTLSGAASGFAVGGPIGAVVGGAAGLASGLIGGAAKKRAARKARIAKQQQFSMNNSLSNTAEIQAEANSENPLAYTFANGGYVPAQRPTETRSMYQLINDISNSNTDFANRLNEPTLRTIPNSSDGVASHKMSYGNDEYGYYVYPEVQTINGKLTDLSSNRKTAHNSARTNKDYVRVNNEDEARLFTEHYKEYYPSFKQFTAPAFANGGVLPGNLAYVDDGEVIRYPNGDTANVPEQGQSTDQNLVNLPQESAILSDKLKLKQLNGKTPAEYYKQKSVKIKYGTDALAQNSAMLNKQNNDNLYRNILSLQQQENVSKGRKQSMKPIPSYANGKPLSATIDWKKNMASTVSDIPTLNLNQVPLSNSAQLASPATTITKLPTDYKNSTTTTPPPATKGTGFDFGSFASLAPVAYNLAQSFKQPELETPVQNPYANQISSTMAGRRYNINPAVQANARSRAISNYNLSQMSPGTGTSMAARVQSAIGQYTANADLYGAQQNYNNQYSAENANTLNSLGQQNVQAQTAANTQNRAARNARETFAGTAASQFGQWAQTQQQMSNQRANDRAILPALQKFLSAGHTNEEMQNLMALLNR